MSCETYVINNWQYLNNRSPSSHMKTKPFVLMVAEETMLQSKSINYTSRRLLYHWNFYEGPFCTLNFRRNVNKESATVGTDAATTFFYFFSWQRYEKVKRFTLLNKKKRSPQNKFRNQFLWKWIGDIRAYLPAKCTIQCFSFEFSTSQSIFCRNNESLIDIFTCF